MKKLLLATLLASASVPAMADGVAALPVSNLKSAAVAQRAVNDLAMQTRLTEQAVQTYQLEQAALAAQSKKTEMADLIMQTELATLTRLKAHAEQALRTFQTEYKGQ